MIRVCFLSLILLISQFAFSSEKYIGLTRDDLKKLGGEEISSGMWGDNFGVDMRTLKGQRLIFLIEFSDKLEQINGVSRPIVRTVDYLKIDLKKAEHVSDGGSFRCRKDQTHVIGLFKKKAAKEKGFFPAERAWKIDDTSKKFVALSDVSNVKCDWFRNGDEAFPF